VQAYNGEYQNPPFEQIRALDDHYVGKLAITLN